MGRGAAADPSDAPAAGRRGDELAAARAQLAELQKRPPLAGEEIALVSLVGSRGYGLARADSDYDYRGLYLAAPDRLLGLEPPQPQLEAKTPDLVIFELGKFVKLAANGNPNILEVLWAEPVVVSAAGARLREQRRLFISARARAAYSGFVRSQLARLEKLGDGPEDARRRRRCAFHAARVLEQGRQLLSTGELELRVADPAALQQLSAAPKAEVLAELHCRDAEFQALESQLPDAPDVERLNELVISLRRDQLAAELRR